MLPTCQNNMLVTDIACLSFWGSGRHADIQHLPTKGLVTTTETILFCHKSVIPTERHKDITYGHIVCTYRSEKKDPYRIVNYPDDCDTPTADIITVKLLLNSVVSTVNVRFMTINLKDFSLMTHDANVSV